MISKYIFLISLVLVACNDVEYIPGTSIDSSKNQLRLKFTSEIYISESDDYLFNSDYGRGIIYFESRSLFSHIQMIVYNDEQCRSLKDSLRFEKFLKHGIIKKENKCVLWIEL